MKSLKTNSEDALVWSRCIRLVTGMIVGQCVRFLVWYGSSQVVLEKGP